jgi:hypothetical protein
MWTPPGDCRHGLCVLGGRPFFVTADSLSWFWRSAVQAPLRGRIGEWIYSSLCSNDITLINLPLLASLRECVAANLRFWRFTQ